MKVTKSVSPTKFATVYQIEISQLEMVSIESNTLKKAIVKADLNSNKPSRILRALSLIAREIEK